jgi:GntR family transcriptional regulator/MocR family aminotransferase
MEFHISLVGRKDLSGEIYRQIRRAILEGRLRPKAVLPPSRELARSLSVSRTTVTIAYARLAGEGFVASRVGAGTYVRENVARLVESRWGRRPEGVLRARPVWERIPLPTAFARRAEYDFRSGLPDTSLFPYTRWRRLLARERPSGDSRAGGYGHPAGLVELRAAIVRHVGISRGVQATSDDVIITNGTQQAIALIARILLAPGDQVAVEDPGYGPPRHMFTALGAKVAGVPVDREGMIVDALSRHARLVYLTPSHQYPLGVSLSLARRHALLAWAERHNAAIIEDDYDSEFRFDGRPLEPLQALDTAGRVIYVGSFSKALLPALRVGFLISPPSLRDALHRAKFVTDWHTSTLIQAPLARFIEDGTFARHLRKVSGIYRTRRAAVLHALERDFSEYLEPVPSAAGLHLAAQARHHSCQGIAEVVRRASEVGVEVQDLARFAVGNRKEAGVVLAYGAVPTDRIAEGLRLFRDCFSR